MKRTNQGLASAMQGNGGNSWAIFRGAGRHAARLGEEGMKLVSRVLWSTVYAVSLVTIAFGGGTALAADIYVDAVNGSDATGDGSSGNPYASIGMGLSVAVSGDTVHAAPGDYDPSLESFPLDMVPGVSLVADQGTAVTFISTDGSDTLVEFDGANFDASSAIQGFTLRGTSDTAASNAYGIVVGSPTSDPALTMLSPIIQDNVISGVHVGIQLEANNDAAALDVGPTINNNVIDGFYYDGIRGAAFQADTLSPTITQNMLVSAYVESSTSSPDYRGVALYAAGADADDGAGALVNAAIEHNVFRRAGGGVYLYAGSGTVVAPPRLDGGKEQLSPTVGSDVVTPALVNNPFGGTISAYVQNNVFGGRDIPYPAGVIAITDNDDDQGGNVDLTIRRNTMFGYYGVYLGTFGANSDTVGGRITADIRDNLMDATYYDNTFSIGVHAGTYGAGSQIDIDVVNNEIRHNYGVLLFAEGSEGSEGSGGTIAATVTDNTIDSMSFYNYSYGVYGWAGEGYGYQSTDRGGEGGTIEVEIARNDINAYQGVMLFAEGGSGGFFSSYDLSYGGSFDATIDRNVIQSVNEYQQGYGVYLFAAQGDENGAAYFNTGGSLDVSMTNNQIRGYYGVYLFADMSVGASYPEAVAVADVSAVNNTIVGGGNGGFYDSGSAMYLFAGDALGEFHPTIDNNVMVNMPATYDAVMYVGTGTNPFGDPASLDNNDIVHRRVGAPLASIRGYYFYSTGVINSFDFADANVSVEPNFACEDHDNWKLLATSPLIDAGKSSGAPAIDLEGDARPIGAGIDIGADEFNGTKVGRTFQDVGPDSIFYLFVEALAGAGITGGCNAAPPLYCPTMAVSREQMAVFLIRAMGASPVLTGAQMFADVPSTRFSYGYVQALALLGVTSGCGGGLFCPLESVTREQMAAFLLKALGEAPGGCTGMFADVGPANPYCGYIEKLKTLGITGGCTSSSYCPTSVVTREQMAAFLVKAFGISLPLPCTSRVAERHGVQPGVVPEVQAPVGASETALFATAGGIPAGADPALLARDAPAEARGASAAVGPVANQYLKLDARHRDLMTPKKATSTPNRDRIAGRSAAASMTRKEFRAAVQARVDAFTADWVARGKDPRELHMGKVRGMMERQIRHPSAPGPKDVDRWVLRGDAERKHYGKQRRMRVKSAGKGVPGATTSPAAAPVSGGRVR